MKCIIWNQEALKAKITIPNATKSTEVTFRLYWYLEQTEIFNKHKSS